MNSIGDQARAYALQISSNRIKTTLATLTQEVASGEVADLGQRLQGNTRALGEIESRIQVIEQARINGRETGTRLQALQDMFDSIRSTTSELGIALANDPVSQGGLSLDMRAVEVAQTFDTVISRLNGTHNNRYLLSGEASDIQPIAGSGEILDRLQALTAAMTSAADVEQAISDWFDAPVGAGGYLDTAYRGTTGVPQRITVGDGITVDMETTGASPAIRALLKGLATAAIADRGVLAGNADERRALLVAGGIRMVSADTAVLGEMGRVGLAQQVVERAEVSSTTALNTLQRARTDVRSADPFETAAALTEVQSQLESLYAVTARLSKLKLVDFLR